MVVAQLPLLALFLALFPGPPAAIGSAPDVPLSLFVRSMEVDLGEVSALEPLLGSRQLFVLVRSPRRWRLTVRAEEDFRGASTQTIPAERLQLRVASAPFLPLSRVQPITLATGMPTDESGEPLEADLLLQIGWEDPPGIYSATILLTLTEEP